MNKPIIKKMIPWIVKIIFSFFLTIYAFFLNRSLSMLLFCMAELLIIFILSNIILKKGVLGLIFHYILFFLYNLQIIILINANSYLTLMMISSLDSINALSGKMSEYLIVIIILCIITFLPIKNINLKVPNTALLSTFLAIELVLTMHYGNNYSPLYTYLKLISQQDKIKKQQLELEGGKDYTSIFYSNIIQGNYSKPEVLKEQPNIIIVFTEGLSENIISDSRKIMPNVRRYEKKSISFKNYYNHTFATYRGIIGSLYSGYQMDDYDANNLISIQSILKKQGYNTTFINVEPNNMDFTKYVNTLGFDEVLGSPGLYYTGMANSISDKEAYELLYDTAFKNNEKGPPFLTVMYTFGTHASLNSTDELFEEGNNPLLNKFYNLDFQFGIFMEKFENSSLADNTIIVFTTDHATYEDVDYNNSFPNTKRKSVDIDKIPFFIYHKNIEKKVIDVSGRNSLDTIPTILDYLDISTDNYFLGRSLFIPKETLANDYEFDTIFYNPYEIKSTNDGKIVDLNETESQIFNEQLNGYLMAKKQGYN